MFFDHTLNVVRNKTTVPFANEKEAKEMDLDLMSGNEKP